MQQKKDITNIKVLLRIASVVITILYIVFSTNLLSQFQTTKIPKKKRNRIIILNL